MAKKFYSAPTDSKGNVILSATALPGSESYWDRLEWLGSTRVTGGSGEGSTIGNLFNRWNNLALETDPNPPIHSLEELDFDFDSVYATVAYMESTMLAMLISPYSSVWAANSSFHKGGLMSTSLLTF